MEKIPARFPRYGKLLGHFSTLWKTFFHTVENPDISDPPPPGLC